MEKTLYDIQDMLDDAYNLLDEISEEVNNLINENEALKAKETKRRVNNALAKLSRELTLEEALYLEYYKEFYGKEL